MSVMEALMCLTAYNSGLATSAPALSEPRYRHRLLALRCCPCPRVSGQLWSRGPALAHQHASCSCWWLLYLPDWCGRDLLTQHQLRYHYAHRQGEELLHQALHVVAGESFCWQKTERVTAISDVMFLHFTVLQPNQLSRKVQRTDYPTRR